jgi:hypothetical protein
MLSEEPTSNNIQWYQVKSAPGHFDTYLNSQIDTGSIQRQKSAFLSFSRQENWKKGRLWLMYDNNKNVMMCSFSTPRNDNNAM